MTHSMREIFVRSWSTLGTTRFGNKQTKPKGPKPNIRVYTGQLEKGNPRFSLESTNELLTTLKYDSSQKKKSLWF